MRPRTTLNDGAPSSACMETPVMRSPSASTWPKWTIPMSSTPSTAVSSSSRARPRRRSGARVQFHPLLGGSSTSASRPAPKVTARNDPGHAEGRADDRRPDGDRGPTLARVEGHRHAELAGRREVAAGEQGRGGPSKRRRRSGQADPSGAPRSEGRARTEQDHEQQRADPQHEHIDVDPWVGLGLPRLADRHQERASDREHDGKPGTGHDDRERRRGPPRWCSRRG